MGIVRTASSRREVMEKFHRPVSARLSMKNRKEEALEDCRRRCKGAEAEKLVCVTSGASYLGTAIVSQLLSRGYSVRLALDNEGDLEKLRKMEMFGDDGHPQVSTFVVKLTELDSMCEAFDGCHGVFHTSSFIDPNGLSGYSERGFNNHEREYLQPSCCLGIFDQSAHDLPVVLGYTKFDSITHKWMAELEYKASQTVIEACARTSSVSKCIFTSSLLACIWRSSAVNDLPLAVDESCWSDESFCWEKELWLALGKTMAEKGAWEAARDRDVQLMTICAAVITGPQFRRRSATASFAYLKGANDMYKHGLLATVDVSSVAQANICVYEEIGNGASGRYICFDRIIDEDDEAIKLEQQMGIPGRIAGNMSGETSARFELSNRKLARLSLKQPRCFDNV